MNSFCHRSAANQAEIFGAAKRAEDNIEQMKKIVPHIACEIPFGQNVCELMFVIHVSNLGLTIKINPVKQPIQGNSVGS